MKENKPGNAEPLAIVGIGCMFPKAPDTAAYWSNIVEGVDAITDVPGSHWNPADYYSEDQQAPDMTYAMRGGFIEPVAFDPLLYGMSPNNIEATDTTQLLGMVAAREALLDAGYATGRDSGDGRPFDRDRTSVILGVTGTLELVIPLGARLGHPLWRRALKDAGVDDRTADEVVKRIAEGYVPWQENSFPGLLGNVAAGRIANRFDLGGTNCVVDAACASSLSAIHMAAMELQSGRSDMAITGGLDTFNDIFMYMCFSKTPALSPTGNSRPFHIGGDGTILGEGLGVIVIKRLTDAERDGDRIYAIIRGIGASSDGKGNAIYAPSPGGQQKALRMACTEAGVRPRTIELVEAHGTGTRVGDAVEAEALSGVYREDQAEGTWCAIGSVKSMIGHTKAAAGVAGLIKIALALRHKVLPPTIKVDQPLDSLQPGQAPVYVNTRKRPWLPPAEHPRRAAVSAFGFGGSNFHAVLEEYGSDKEIGWDGNVQLFACSSDDRQGIGQVLAGLDSGRDWSRWRQAAAESRRAFDPKQSCRLLLVLQRGRTDPEQLISNALSRLDSAEESWSTPDGSACFGSAAVPGKLAMLFPGQGSQYTGMLRDLCCQFPQLLEVLAKADRVAGPDDPGLRLSDRIYPFPVFDAAAASEQEAKLRATQTAQPAIGAVSLGALRILEHFGVRAEVAAGHSFGELTALCCANCINENDFLALARKRGELMQKQGGDYGAMLAVIADASQIYTLIEEEQLDLIIANHNAPNQVVLSGATDQIDKAAGILEQRQLQAKRLPVAAAFHSSFVADAEKPLAEFLESFEFRQPDIPVFANTTTGTYPFDTTRARQLLAGQLARPVEFVEEIENMYEAGVRTFVEVGPGNTLTGLVRSILADRQHLALALDASRGRSHNQYDLALLLARVAALGYPCDLQRWDEGWLDRLRDEASPALTIPISGANYVTPRQKTPPLEPPAPVAAQAPAMSTPAQAAPPAGAGTPSDEVLEMTTRSIQALQAMQEQTAQLHRQYLEGMQASQLTIQQLIMHQQGLLAGQPVTAPVADRQAVAGDSQPLPAGPDQGLPDAPPSGPAVVPADPDPAGDNRYENIVLEVVAEKTGYPVDMLSLNMSLDTDLGIDSIKRVEILSALQERVPGMQQIQPGELGTFQLLQHIVEFMGSFPGTGAGVTTEVHTPQDTGTRYRPALLEVVAEKTGYPVDMLSLEMHLDSDLGIDSIKRVEILSALQERLPEAPPVNPEDLAGLQTLQTILTALHGTQADRQAAGTDAAPAESDADPSTPDGIYRSTIELVPVGDARPPVELAGQGPILVADDGTDLAEMLCAEFRRQALDAKVINLSDPLPEAAAALILPAPEQADAGFIEAAFALLQQSGRRLRLLAGITRLGGKLGLAGPLSAGPVSAGLAGLIKTADKEWPAVHCKHLDIPAGEIAANMAVVIAGELLLAGPLEVGIGAGGKVTPELATLPVSFPGDIDTPFAAGEVIVISGGARGITAEVAVSLAEHCRVNLLLLGRTPAPGPEPEWCQGLADEAAIKQAIITRGGERKLTPREVEQACRGLLADREIRASLARIEAAGVKFSYQAVDIRDHDRVAEILDGARRELGPVAGLVHGAGVLADRLIADKTLEQFRQVWSTKVDGLQALLSALGTDPLKAVVLFSSTTARFGRKGQADYAAANEVLNKTARQLQQQRPECRVLSVNWGPWDGGMVGPQLKQVFAEEGLDVIPVSSGLRFLRQEIAASGPVEVVVLGSELPPAVGPADTGPEPADSMQVAFTRDLNIETCPVLKSHVMNGKAVLPAAIIAEWLAHGAVHASPGQCFLGFDDLRILKGVVLPAGERLELRILAGSPVVNGGEESVPVELRSETAVHARARILLGPDYPGSTGKGRLAIQGDCPLSDPAFYDNGRLFHGPDLQGIRSIDTCTETAISGLVQPAPPPAEWMAAPIRSNWLADPLMLDAAFQMLILWGFEQTGTGSLPAAIGSYRQFRRSMPKTGIRVTARIVKQTGNGVTADIEFLDEEGQLLASIDGYECVSDASLRQAFSRNRLETQTH